MQNKVIEEIKLQVGRTGQVTPLAIVKPTRVAGSTISKCTLHNFDYIEEKDIRVGDTVKIRKAGDVIPEITTVVMDKRENQEKYIIPTVCPVCGEILEKEDGQVALRCTNTECEAQTYRAITHFASRDAMDIDGFSESTAYQLIDERNVINFSDLYKLTYEQLDGLEGFKKKKTDNLINAIEKSKTPTMDAFIYAIGIEGVGRVAAKDLAARFKNMENLQNATFEELLALDNVGEITANAILAYFQDERNQKELLALREVGVVPTWLDEKREGVFSGESVVLTGTLTEFKRSEAQKLIEERGGVCQSSVTANTTLVLAGAEAGSKLAKAQKLGVKIIDEATFKGMIE